ncbi:DMT family transporter [Methylobacterium fujisawaense]|nr:DMT family transporter [Methylobacterium fujisawaense]MDH3030316.1 DMT family transporter [Methylobacterium fujisawaense]
MLRPADMPMLSRPSPLAAGALPALFIPIWATGFISARAVVPHVDPLAFTAIRFTAVALVLALIATASRVRWPGDRAGWRDPVIAGFLMQGVYLSGVFWAVSHGLPAGIAALVGSLQPLLTALLAQPLLGERVSGRRALGIMMGFVGTGLVLAPKLGATDPSGIPPLALAVSLLAVLALTLGTLWQKRTGGRVDLLAGATLQFVGGMACAIPLALAFGSSTAFDPAPALWLGLGWAVLVNSVAGILLLLVLIRRGAVAGVAALFFLVPPVAAVLGYLLFGEVLTPLQGAGMALAALGVAVASRG